MAAEMEMLLSAFLIWSTAAITSLLYLRV
jgi:hypothetical protein